MNNKEINEVIERLTKNVHWMRSEEVFNRYLNKRATDDQLDQEREPTDWERERAECRRSELADAIQILRERGKVI